MKKLILLLVAGLFIGALGACGSDDPESDGSDHNGEVKIINTQYDQPNSADVGETVTLKALVTLGEDEETVTDAEVKFEYWIKDDENNSTTVEADTHNDGTYTANVTFEEDAIYEMYAHTNAEGQHTMPMQEIIIGEGNSNNVDDESENNS